MGKSNIDIKNKVLQGPAAGEVTLSTGIIAGYGGVEVVTFTVPSTTQAVTAAALSFGKSLGTLPKGKIFVHAVELDLDYVASTATTAQMDIGVGTVLASGVHATLNVATNEDCLDGQTSTALAGTASVNYPIAAVGEVDLKDGSATAKELFLNLAGTFVGSMNIIYSGNVTVVYSVFN